MSNTDLIHNSKLIKEEEIKEVPKKRKTKKATLQIMEEEPTKEVKPKKRILKKVKLNITEDDNEEK